MQEPFSRPAHITKQAQVEEHLTLLPEQRAREKIDAQLVEAGWALQNRDEVNLTAARGVAVREFKLAPGHGFVDYMPSARAR